MNTSTVSALDAMSVTIFYPAGLARAYRTVKLHNWNGTAVMAKRSFFDAPYRRAELNEPGIYMIYGEDAIDEATRLYIGEGDPVLARIKTHRVDKDKDFWTDMVSFSTPDKSLTKAHIKYLEAKLIQLADAAKRCKIENATKPSYSSLSESETASADAFLRNILDCLSILNVTFFRLPERIVEAHPTSFELNGKGAAAKAYRSQGGFTVTAGSTATKQLSNAFKAIRSSSRLRQSLIDSKALSDEGGALRFTVDYEFDSPSAAATVVYGNPMNGRTAWRTHSGLSLKDVQASEIEI